MLVQRRRPWTNVNPTLIQRLVSARLSSLCSFLCETMAQREAGNRGTFIFTRLLHRVSIGEGAVDTGRCDNVNVHGVHVETKSCAQLILSVRQDCESGPSMVFYHRPMTRSANQRRHLSII